MKKIKTALILFFLTASVSFAVTSGISFATEVYEIENVGIFRASLNTIITPEWGEVTLPDQHEKVVDILLLNESGITEVSNVYLITSLSVYRFKQPDATNEIAGAPTFLDLFEEIEIPDLTLTPGVVITNDKCKVDRAGEPDTTFYALTSGEEIYGLLRIPELTVVLVTNVKCMVNRDGQPTTYYALTSLEEGGLVFSGLLKVPGWDVYPRSRGNPAASISVLKESPLFLWINHRKPEEPGPFDITRSLFSASWGTFISEGPEHQKHAAKD